MVQYMYSHGMAILQAYGRYKAVGNVKFVLE
jgi:hypothetical protein